MRRRGHIALFSANEQTRQRVLGALQSIAVRAAATFPMRKFRGVFIDPVGMGNNFPFKNFPEFMTGPKTYTRSDEIREQLRALTVHVEQVIQKYLSADFETIEDFNQAKSFVKEPYRYLFVADFPVGFDNSSLEDLKSLLTNGARAGVYVIVHIDRTLGVPRVFDYGLFDSYCSCVLPVLNDESFGLQDFYYLTKSKSRIPRVILDGPPSLEQLNRLAEEISLAFKMVQVETVPFTELRPHSDDEWSFTSEREIRAPFGVSGALDHIEFWMGYNEDGKVISNGLLAGKPGAGKSYALHAIIANLAMRYSPDELELYLLDFKEGVEFQIYVDPLRSENTNPYEELDESRALPHAKVVSIDSDREFGLSVMKRVQEELEKRGEQFRAAGVEKLTDFRKKLPTERMPRVLIVIDEFQYMFLKTDDVTRELNVIFEDIMRRGRAFGIHLLLSTQSPHVPNMSRGIYAFIDLRMAMQMDKSTASSVLADDNVDSVDLIERPGEIIYNDNSGKREYNNFGQVVDISLQVRKQALLDVQEIARKRNYQRPEPLVLFNGLQATKLSRNPQLDRLTRMTNWLSSRDLNKQIINDEDWAPEEFPGVAWLGESMRIGNHTHAILRRRSRSNMLLIGASEEIIFGILGGILISLVHCYQPQKAQFEIIDLSQPDEDRPWSSMTQTFRDAFTTIFPTSIGKRAPDAENNIVRYQAILKSLSQEFDRRRALRDENPDVLDLGPSIFFIGAIGGLNRAQSLRPIMGTRSEQPSEDGQLVMKLAAQGPELGIHSILWFDNMKSFTKLSGEDRAWLTHFDLRVGLTMTAEDSRLLLRELDAQELPRMRALFNDEAKATRMEKFKPYAVLTPNEIHDYSERLLRRVSK
jgi:S-DNA-T family DNA segregation ATPase FtsK/SpoIIIE